MVIINVFRKPIRIKQKVSKLMLMGWGAAITVCAALIIEKKPHIIYGRG